MEVESINENTINLAQSNDTEIKEKLREEILDHIANSNVAFFKSQQLGEPDLNFLQKREIAKNLIIQKPGQFLARFGQFLESSHLRYFTEISEHDSYEIQFHIKQLQRRLNREKNQVDVRNRRFQALKLVDEGKYFSETEMMSRNPLLYDQLIGQFLTKQEIKMRDQSDDNNKTFLGVLMDRMDREDIERLKQQQKDDEDGAKEEVDSSDEEEEEEEEDDDDEEEEYDSEEQEQQSDRDMSYSLNKTSDKETEDPSIETHKGKRKRLSEKEKDLLREEFISHMYESFIEGKDKDFDYSSKVDGNPEYECLTVRTQDEEERYFDSESPENASDDNCSQTNIEDGDDELDMFMKNLKPDPTPSDLAAEVANL